MALSTAFARGLAEALEGMGVAREELLAGSAVSVSDLTNPSLFLDLNVIDELVERAVELTREPALGLCWYEQASFATFGAVGQSLCLAETFRAAVGLIERYWPLFMSRCLMRAQEHEGGWRVIFQRSSHSDVAHRVYAESGIHALCRLLRVCAGVGGVPRLVQFDYPEPAYAPRYQSAFRCPVVFGAETTSLEVDPALADRVNMHAAPDLAARLQSYADGLLESQQGTLSTRVLAFLRERTHLQRVDMEQVAVHLGISERTLRRRLQSEGTPYPLLVQRALRERAESMLQDPSRSVKEVAFALGFADPSAFHRAVRRWTGKPPSELRAASSRPPIKPERSDG